jgi:uncharacterized membrane protein
MTSSSGPESSSQSLPAHVDATVKAIAELHARHHLRATTSERAFAILAGVVPQPRFVAVLTLVLTAWMAGNLEAMRLGYLAWDPPPFSWLQGAVATAALYTTAIILIGQRREDELAALREQLTLELAILGEQKSAKTIELLEALRRDLPSAPNRPDPEASAMARPSDPQSVAEAILETHEATLIKALEDETQDDGKP